MEHHVYPGSGFGGQNQIVNEQEQSKEVNGGGLSATDSEASLTGKEDDKKTEEETKTEIIASDKETDTEALEPELEGAGKKKAPSFPS